MVSLVSIILVLGYFCWMICVMFVCVSELRLLL